MGNHPAVEGRSILPVDGLTVVSWSPGGPGTKPTQVHLLVPVGKEGITIAVRLKSREATQAIIDALANHRDHVWEP
jgi:hypothetical protein